ncbi:MFS transporter [Chromatiaceae bacterium AAb-1]|nr:MFS transporter [Chromatiaceae bacterium AAb-1]
MAPQLQRTSAVSLPPAGLSRQLALGAGFFAMFFASQSVSVLAIPFYQMTLGVDPFLLGMALTLPVLLGTFLSPWVGHLSDHSRSRFGRRRPFVLLASWCSCLAFGAIWMVPAGWSELAQLLYFVCFSVLFYIAATFMAVPMTCLAYEMSPDYHERTAIMGFTTYFVKLGSLLYQWLFPLAQLALFGSVFVGIRYVGWGVAIFIIGLLGTLAAVYSREAVRVTAPVRQRPKLGASLKVLSRNTSLRVLLVLTILQMAGGAFTASMDYYLLVYYMCGGDIAEGSVWKGVLSVSYAGLGFLTVPLIARLSAKRGKITALQWIYLLTIIGGCLKWFIFTPDIRWLLILDAVFCTGVWTTMTMLIPSMMADVCDEDELLHGQRREGLFVALHNWITSLSAALALLLAGLSLNLIGFDAQLQGNQSDTSMLSMRIILSFGTVLFALLSLWCLHYYRLTASRSQHISQQLLQRQQAAEIQR